MQLPKSSYVDPPMLGIMLGAQMGWDGAEFLTSMEAAVLGIAWKVTIIYTAGCTSNYQRYSTQDVRIQDRTRRVSMGSIDTDA